LAFLDLFVACVTNADFGNRKRLASIRLAINVVHQPEKRSKQQRVFARAGGELPASNGTASFGRGLPIAFGDLAS
jgi:hypothetical protein